MVIVITIADINTITVITTITTAFNQILSVSDICTLTILGHVAYSYNCIRLAIKTACLIVGSQYHIPTHVCKNPTHARVCACIYVHNYKRHGRSYNCFCLFTICCFNNTFLNTCNALPPFPPLITTSHREVHNIISYARHFTCDNVLVAQLCHTHFIPTLAPPLPHTKHFVDNSIVYRRLLWHRFLSTCPPALCFPAREHVCVRVCVACYISYFPFMINIAMIMFPAKLHAIIYFAYTFFSFSL